MVKTVLSVYHRGYRDWALQRLSAAYMIVYFLFLFAYFFKNPGLSFAEWHSLYSEQGMKIATLLCLALLLFHAWVGMWTIFTDYVKPYVLRAVLNVAVLLGLVACFFWGLIILWGM